MGLALWFSIATPAAAQDLPSLSVAEAEADESDGAIEFTVILSASASSEVTVDFATSEGAADNEDFTAASGTLAFAPGTTEQSISVSLVDDALDEPDEAFQLTLSDPVGATIDNGVATGTITDNDPEPRLNYEGRYLISISEGEQSDFAVTLTASSGRTVTVDYRTWSYAHGDNDEAEADIDYVHTSESLTFEPGEREKKIRIATIEDDVYEGSETFDLEFTNLQGASFAPRSYRRRGRIVYTGAFIIQDDEFLPGVTIGDSSELESAGNLEFPVNLTGPIDVQVSMRFSTEDGTAASGEDFSAANGTLSIQSGDTSGMVLIPIVDDDVTESTTETFAVSLSQNYSPLADAVGVLRATGTIQDDDGTTTLYIGNASTDEGDGTLEFPVRLGGQSSDSITVDYATASGTAIAGQDFTEATGTVTFAPGDSRQSISVGLVDDDTHEATETFSVTLSGAVGAELGDSTAIGSIQDDEEPPLMTVHGSQGPENGERQFVVTLSKPSETTVTVDYVTDTDFTARPPPAWRLAESGSDFVFQQGTLVFAPGETSKTVRVQVLEDLVDEPVEAVVLTLGNPVNANFEHREGSDMCPWSSCGEECCDCGTILDDDLASLSIVDASATEGAPHMTFQVALNGTGAPTDVAVSVSFATSDGRAVAGEDYEAVSGSLSIPVGTVRQKIEVPLLDDEREEPSETLYVKLSEPVGALLSDAAGTGLIWDDDDPPSISIGDAMGREGESAMFPVTLSEASGHEVAVGYATSDGTASGGSDYDVASGRLTFPPGDTDRMVTVLLLDDAVDEAEETFSVALGSPVNATIDTASADGTGTILDDDEPPAFSVLGGTGEEGEAVAFTVTAAGSGSRPATVFYATSDGTAVAGEDYGAISGTLTFAPGEFSQTLSVSLLEDEIDEPNETFTVRLSSPENATIATGAADGTILDNDGAAQLSIAGASGSEGGDLDFVVALAGTSAESAAVSYATSDGTAIAGEDYRAVSGRLTFAVGESSRTLSVSLVDDALHEPTETFTLTLSSPENAEIAVGSAMGRIEDDDALPALSVADGAGEEGGVVEFAVVLADNGSERATVDYATSDGTAIAGEDYRAVSGRLTFAAGESSRTLSVSLVDDALHEPTETFTLTLSSPENAVIAVGSAMGRIEDDDALPALSVADGAGEEGGVVEFAVVLAGNGSERATVNYATKDVTAIAGEDYLAAQGTLTFAPGEALKTVSVTLLDDEVDEPEETFALELSSPSNVTLSVNEAVGRILDDDDRLACMAPSPSRVLLFEPSLHAHRQGFVRIVNHSSRAGTVLVEAIDDSGMRYGPVPLSIGAGAAAHFNSGDLEAGNADKGLPEGIGASGEGAWRLELTSGLDIEVLSYLRTRDGFLTALHDTAPAASGVHRAVFLNPGGNVDQVSRLRLVNWGSEDAHVTISGTDDIGSDSPEVVVEVPAGTAREWTSAELESGAGTEGALGEGEGKWRLAITSDRPVVVLSLIENPTGHLTNLSTLPQVPGLAQGSQAVPLFPSASDPLGRQGFVRVANRSGEAEEVRIEAFDRNGWDYAPLSLAVAAGETVSFNSDDLELGNAEKGLTGSTGPGEGDWWLELSGGADIGVGSYVRTGDGFLTSMHDPVPEWDGGYRVVFFNPAENSDQVSVLWLVNPGDADAAVTIAGVDDRGVTPGTAVRTTVAAGSSRRLTSTELETGESGAIDSGALGDGKGKWRLRVDSDQPIRVMSLIENPTGHLTNLSTAPDCRPAPDRAPAL